MKKLYAAFIFAVMGYLLWLITTEYLRLPQPLMAIIIIGGFIIAVIAGKVSSKST